MATEFSSEQAAEYVSSTDVATIFDRRSEIQMVDPAAVRKRRDGVFGGINLCLRCLRAQVAL